LIRTVLAAVDSSQRAPGVLAAGREIASRFGARLHVFRAVHAPPDIPAGAHSTDDRGATLLQRRADEELRALVGSGTDDRIEPVEVTDEPPYLSILSTADRIDADLIVIGSHGYRGLDRILGTNAARVVNLGKRSVLVVHERPRPAAP
jgi:nucleotide-binding universal stress UspA family protein